MPNNRVSKPGAHGRLLGVCGVTDKVQRAAADQAAWPRWRSLQRRWVRPRMHRSRAQAATGTVAACWPAISRMAANYAGMGVPRASGALNSACRMCHLAQEAACHFRRLGGREFQHHWQMVGQLAGAEGTGLRVRRSASDLRARATVARSPCTCSNKCRRWSGRGQNSRHSAPRRSRVLPVVVPARQLGGAFRAQRALLGQNLSELR